jgi:hypothetical protein
MEYFGINADTFALQYLASYPTLQLTLQADQNMFCKMSMKGWLPVPYGKNHMVRPIKNFSHASTSSMNRYNDYLRLIPIYIMTYNRYIIFSKQSTAPMAERATCDCLNSLQRL